MCDGATIGFWINFDSRTKRDQRQPMNKFIPLLAGIALFGSTSVAHACFTTGGSSTSTTCAATPGVTTVDFSKVSVGTNQTTVSTSAGGVDVMVTSTGGSLVASGDGLGVAGHGTSDLNLGETLTVKFSAPVDVQQIVLNDVDNGFTYHYITGSVSVYDASGNLVKQVAVVDNVAGDDAMSINLSKLDQVIASVKVTGGIEPVNLGSVCFKVLQGTVGVPELSTKGSLSAGLLLAGLGLVFAGWRRES
jgi:hypothetical protein